VSKEVTGTGEVFLAAIMVVEIVEVIKVAQNDMSS
jgi:hypothetical protein